MSKQAKINNNILDQNSTISRLDVTDSYGILYPMEGEYIFSSSFGISVMITFWTTEHTLTNLKG